MVRDKKENLIFIKNPILFVIKYLNQDNFLTRKK